MYDKYFGLQEQPFSISVNPQFLFMSQRHKDALAHLLYGVTVNGGFVLLTGEVGTGKTTINRALLKQLPENTDTAMVLNPALNALELLATVCDELQIPYDDDKQSLKLFTDKLHDFLLNNHRAGRNTVLLIDEAQHLQFDALEQIRLLTNLETDTKKLLQIILVGQPELEVLIDKKELRQLSQRITARYKLEPLNLEETGAYIRHRLHVAGLPANQSLFSKALVKKIHGHTQGVPRLINVLCDRMMLGTYAKDRSKIDKQMFAEAVAEINGKSSSKVGYVSVLVFSLLLVGVVLAALFQNNLPSPIVKPVSQVSTSTVESKIEAEPVTVVKNKVIINEVAAKELDFGFDEKGMAINKMLVYSSLSKSAVVKPCDVFLNDKGLRCENLSNLDINELTHINRLAVVKLTFDSQLRYFFVVGLSENGVQVLAQDTIETIAFDRFRRHWDGDALVLWRPPKYYAEPILPGNTSAVVARVAQQFSQLDKQSIPLSEGNYNDVLVQRVRLFQAANGLQSDGIIGTKTLLKLNELVLLPGDESPVLMRDGG